MKQSIAPIVLAFLVELSAAHLVAQFPPSPELPSHWIPFTAKLTETHSSLRPLPGSYDYDAVQIVGEFACNRSGETYVRWLNARADKIRLPSVAVLTDRQAGTKMEIDYRLKNVRRTFLDLKGHPELAADPMTWKVFLKSHAQDRPLGRKTVSGIECVDYRIHDPETRLKMYWDEVCFAPSLNFLAIKSNHMSPSQRVVTVQLEKVQIGEPDPDLFHIPRDFSTVH